ncbi:MAG: hypothetical protein JO144_05130, partial [Actinobacteria bacterium]|nr:hypothetical protein [Actinomycetota bacterium]
VTRCADQRAAILDSRRLRPELRRALERALGRAAPGGAGGTVLTVFDGARRRQVRLGDEHGELAAGLRQAAAEYPVAACAALAALTDLIAAQLPAGRPRLLVSRLADQAAGIRPGPLGIADLVRGGSNYLPGTGLGSPFDDGTSGQVRHFCGIAASTARLGARATLLLSERLRGDGPGTADDNLTRKAVEFTRSLLDGRLPPDAAGAWITANICSTGRR